MNKLFIPFIVLVTSCSMSSKENSNVTLEKLSEISILVDSSTNYNFFSMDVYETNENSYLIGFDIIFQTVNVFDLNQRKLIKKLSMTTEGENGTKKIDGVFFHNFDSIFLFHRYPTTVYLTDTSGVIKHIWPVINPLPKPLDGYKYLLELSFANKQAYFEDQTKSIYLQLYYDTQPMLKSMSLPVIGQYFLNDDAVKNTFATRPQEFLDLLIDNKFFGAIRLNPRFVVIRDKTYLAYPFDHSIEVYDSKSGKKVGETICKSELDDEFATTNLEYPGAEETEKYYIEEPSYEGLIYDKYRDLIYRIVKHSQPYKDENNKRNMLNESPWSLLILDNSLRTIAESHFEGKLYDFNNVFISKNGLIVRHLDEHDGIIKVSLFDVNKIIQ